ncbi:MAG: hypothetical protein QF896_05000 [Acidimicrobiales bacterium]|nr:hypothetical protein [Acidimicrobiales bacterium]
MSDRDETVQSADDRTSADRMEHEARILADVQLPGVVVLLGFQRRGDRAELRLGDADHPDMATQPLVDAVALCRLGSALARTIAEVHRAGVAHGNLRSDVVLVDERGLPVLSGFTSARVVAPGEMADDDIGALGSLLIDAHGRLRPSDSSTELRRRKRLNKACRPVRHETAGDMAARLADLSVAFQQEAGGDEVPPDLDESIRARVTRTSSSAGRLRKVAAVAAGVAAIAVGIVAIRGGERATIAPVVVPTVSPDGPVVEHDGQRFQLGSIGDVVVIGDWADPEGRGCDGLQTPALLRPSTGAVYVFDAWADSGVLAADATMIVSGAATLESDTGGDCDLLRAVGPEIDAQVRAG